MSTKTSISIRLLYGKYGQNSDYFIAILSEIQVVLKIYSLAHCGETEVAKVLQVRIWVDGAKVKSHQKPRLSFDCYMVNVDEIPITLQHVCLKKIGLTHCAKTEVAKLEDESANQSFECR